MTPKPMSEKPRETLAQLLDESKMQVTFTGWKAELEQAEKKLAAHAEILEMCEKALSNIKIMIEQHNFDTDSGLLGEQFKALERLKELK